MLEIIQGKKTRRLNDLEFVQRMAGYDDVLIDLGTGDGRFVVQAARSNTGLFAIGVDASRENLVDASRTAPENALFVIAGAQSLPVGLTGLAGRLTINFPWGSLLEGLLDNDEALLAGLQAVTRPGAKIEVRLNASALSEAGWELETGTQRVAQVLGFSEFRLRAPVCLDSAGLRALHTTWARRLAFGRDPRGTALTGYKVAPRLLTVPRLAGDPMMVDQVR